jgi:hypothetical protein
MKKVLVTVAALGLVAGVATTASAVEWKMSGKYMVEGAYLSDAAGAGVLLNDTATGHDTSDAYYLHTFETNVGMKVNDKVSMNAVVRLADDTFWGSQDDVSTSGSNVGPANGDVYMHQLYMDYMSPIGKIRVGRAPAGTYGTNFMDSDKRADRIMLWPSFLASGPVSTLFYLEKVRDGDTSSNTETAKDTDTYVARVYYNTDTVDAGLHYGYSNNKSGSMSFYDDTNFSALQAATTLAILSDQRQQLTAYGKFKLDNYFVNAELTHYFGDLDVTATESYDYDSWAGMLQVGGKFGNMTPSLMYFYAQGQDLNSTDNDIETALMTTGTGDKFEPLYILTGRHTGLLNNDVFAGGNGVLMSVSGIHALVAAADYKVSDALTLHGAIGWAKADETLDPITTNQDDEYGWEYNIGAAYKLLDNLTYEAHFGYLDTGDYFNYGSTTDHTQNIYTMSHSLTMTF